MNIWGIFCTFFIPALVAGCLCGGVFVYTMAMGVIGRQREEITRLKKQQTPSEGEVLVFRRAG